MKQALSDRVRLGVFEVDLRAGELRQGEGAVLVLPEQPWQILRMLIEAGGEIVTREEIRQRLWPDDTVVEFDSSINNAIKKLRRALVDSADEPHYIGTIAKRGYRLLVPVVRVGAEEDGPAEPNQTAGPSTRPASSAERAGLGRDDTINKSPSVGQIIAEPRVRPRGKWIVPAVIVCAVAIAGVLYWRTHRAPKLTERDTIVLADFDNSTGDPVFDDTLKQGLALQLEQSPFLNVLSDGKTAGTLKLMNRAGERLTGVLAREVCLRTDSQAVVNGAIARLGSDYVIGLKVVNCSTGDVLAQEQKQAASKEAVLKALDAGAISLRSKLGESLASVERYATPLEEVTTPSLEALKAYSLARKMNFTKGGPAALPFLQEAVKIDPNFAAAYAAMSIVYGNRKEVERQQENARKAYDLRGKVSERERLFIEAIYYMSATGELDKAAAVYELWQQIYPRDYIPYLNLSLVYFRLGNHEKALEETLMAGRFDRNRISYYVNLSSGYTALGRLKEADAVYQQAQQLKLASGDLLLNQYGAAFLEGDTAQMENLIASVIGKPGTEDILLAAQADTDSWYGKLRTARGLTQRAIDSARHNDAGETAAGYLVAEALREVEAGETEQAKVDANLASKLAPNRDVRAMAALALARVGDVAAAEKLTADLDKTSPFNTLVQRYWLPSTRAAIALQHKDARRALELLQVATAIELSLPPADGVNVELCPVYLRGEAYLMLHDGKAAAAEFQKFVDHYGLITNFPWGALARLGLARAYALEGETDPAYREKARTAYQNFLTLWKDADPDIPIYKQAKAEHAKLQ